MNDIRDYFLVVFNSISYLGTLQTISILCNWHTFYQKKPVFILDIYDCSYLRWIAVSQDLLWFNGGPIRYGDTVYVYAGHKTGAYIVRDAMNKRFKNKIDFLESVGTDLYSFDEAKLIINS